MRLYINLSRALRNESSSLFVFYSVPVDLRLYGVQTVRNSSMTTTDKQSNNQTSILRMG